MSADLRGLHRVRRGAPSPGDASRARGGQAGVGLRRAVTPLTGVLAAPLPLSAPVCQGDVQISGGLQALAAACPVQAVLPGILHRHGDAPREAPPRRPHGRRVPAARPGSAASWAVILCALGSLRGDGLGPRLVHVTHVPSHHGSADSGDRAGSRSQALASGHAPSGRPVLVVAVSVCGPPGSWGQSGRPGRAAQASAPEFAERQAWTEFAATLEEAQAGGEGCPSCLRRSVPGLELGAWPATTAAAGSPSWGPAGLQGHRAMASFWAAGPACARGWAEAASRPSSSRSALTPPPRQHPAQGHSLPPRDCRRDGGAGLCAALEALGNSSPGSVERQPRGGRPPPVPSSEGAS